MTAALAATLIAAIIGFSHWLSHRAFGDEVYNSKSGVGKATVVVTAVAWILTYVAAGGDMGLIVLPAEAFLKGLGRLGETVLMGLGELIDGLLPGAP
jgi:hypothetical protein